MTAKLQYWLMKAKSSPEAAFNAGRLLDEEGFNEVMVQTQFRNSAEGGYVPAQRYLGILGLCGRLLKPGSVYMSEEYYCDYSQAIRWFKAANQNGDVISRYLLAKCMQHGIGIPKDEVKAKKIITRVIPFITMEHIISIAMIFDKLTHDNPRRPGPSSIAAKIPELMELAS